MIDRMFQAALASALALAACEIPDVTYEYRRTADAEVIAVSGVPDDVDAVVSVAGSEPAPLPEDGIVELPPGLSGEFTISVAWQSGFIVTTRGHSTRVIDLDAERAAQ